MIDHIQFESIPATTKSIAFRKKVYGVGVNDSTFITGMKSESGKYIQHPAYEAWKGMLRRCYSSLSLKKCKTYIGVYVCDEWLSFSSYHQWWIVNFVDGHEIDKDILSDEKVYSPETSIFIPHWLNSFVIDSAAIRGAYPIGVTKNSKGGGYVSRCSNPITGNREIMGIHESAMEAFSAWRNRKLEIALELKPQMDAIDLRIYPRVVTIINSKR